MTTWMKNVNNFQKTKVQSQGVASISLIFCQCQTRVTYKSVAYKKKRVLLLVLNACIFIAPGET